LVDQFGIKLYQYYTISEKGERNIVIEIRLLSFLQSIIGTDWSIKSRDHRSN